MQMQSESGDETRNDLRSDAENLTGAATDRLHSEVDARKAPMVEQARSVSAALDKAAGEMGGAAPSWVKSALEQSAQQIQRVAESIEQKDSRALFGDIRQLARNNPVTFLTACAAAGFAASRILRADGTEPTGDTAMSPPDVDSTHRSAPQEPTSVLGGSL